MKNYLKTLLVALILVGTAISCSKDDSGSGSGPEVPPPPPPNTAPAAVSQLIFPSSDLLCIDNTITFQWDVVTDPDGDPVSYQLQVAEDRNFTDIVEQRVTNSGAITITLERGKAFYWRVTARDNQGNSSSASSTFAFYTEGDGVSNYAPFTAALNAPADGGTVTAGTVTLDWTGGDTDTGDVLSYDLYFGEVMDPPLTQSDLSVENFDVAATAGTTYYWRVDTIDNSGAKTIGQIWSFTAN